MPVVGWIDWATASGAKGWAVENTPPNTPVTVSVLSDGVEIASAVAKEIRADVKAAGASTEVCGWVATYQLPVGKHVITAKVGGTLLKGSHTVDVVAAPSTDADEIDTAIAEIKVEYNSKIIDGLNAAGKKLETGNLVEAVTAFNDVIRNKVNPAGKEIGMRLNSISQFARGKYIPSAPFEPPVLTEPSVALTSPVDLSTHFTPGAVISLVATATAGGNSQLVKVEFFRNNGALPIVSIPAPGPYTYNDAGLTAGTYAYTAKVTDNLNRTVFSTIRTIYVVTSTGNWTTRSTAAGVIRAWKLESSGSADANFAGREHYDSHGLQPNGFGLTNYITIDPTMAPPGSTACLRMETPSPPGVPPAGAYDGVVGAWFGNFDSWANGTPAPFPSANKIRDVGDKVYIQHLYRVNASWVETDIRQYDGVSKIGHKISDLVGEDRGFGNIFATSENGKIVHSTWEGMMFSVMYRYYPYNSTDNMNVNRAGGDTDVQPRGAPDGQFVSYLDISAHTPSHGYIPANAKGVITKDVWHVFNWEIEILANGFTPGNPFRICRLKLYHNLLGATSRELVHDYQGEFTLPYKDGDPDAAVGWGKFYLFPFLTSKSLTQTHPTMYCWYAQLIVSSQPIALPTGAPALPPVGSWNPTWRSGRTIDVMAPIAGSAPQSVDLRPMGWARAPGAPDTWSQFVFGNSCGLAFDELRGDVYSVAAGGHGTIDQNGVYVLRLKNDAPVWTTLTDSTQHTMHAEQNQNVAYFPSDGRPTSRHNYYFLHVVEIDGLPVVLALKNAAATWGFGELHNGVYTAPSAADAYHPDRATDVLANPWDKVSATSSGWPGYPGGNTPGLLAKDPRTQLVWLWDYQGDVWRLNPVTKTWSLHSFAGHGAYAHGMCVDTLRNRLVYANSFDIVAYGKGGVMVQGMGNGVKTSFALSGDYTWFQYQGMSQMAYDTINDRYLHVGINSPSGPGTTCKVTAINPTTWFCTVLCDAPMPDYGEGIEGTVAFIPQLRGLVYQPRFDTPCQFMPVAA